MASQKRPGAPVAVDMAPLKPRWRGSGVIGQARGPAMQARPRLEGAAPASPFLRQVGFQPVEPRLLAGQDLRPRLGQREPRDPVDLGKLGAPPAAWRPL